MYASNVNLENIEAAQAKVAELTPGGGNGGNETDSGNETDGGDSTEGGTVEPCEGDDCDTEKENGATSVTSFATVVVASVFTLAF